MYSGKKVTDPIPLIPKSSKDHAWVWDTIGKSRTESRRMEHHVEDAKRATLFPLSENLRTIVGQDQTYTVHDQWTTGTAAFTKPLKTDHGAKTKQSQGTRRKVSRLDEKYFEEEIKNVGWVTSKKGMDKESRPRNRNGFDHRLELQQRHAQAASPKRVEFLPKFQLREVNNDGTYLDSVAGPVDSSYNPYGLQSKVADGYNKREKVIQSVNGDLGNTYNFSSVHREPSGVGHSGVGVSHSGVGHSGFGHSGVGYSGVGHSGGYKERPAMETRSTVDFEQFCRVRDGDAVSKRGTDLFTEGKCQKRLLKKNLTDLPHNDEILAKLKGKIRQQRLNHSLSESSRDDSVVAAVPATMECSGNLSMDYNLNSFHDDPIHMARTSVRERIDATEKYPKGRKVAAGPPVPVYKGFAEVDKRMFPTHRIVSRSGGKRSGKRGASSKEKKTETYSDEHDEAEKVKKVTRIVSSESKSSKQGAKDIITTSSWRVGQEIIRQKLGPARSKTQQHDPFKIDYNKEELENKDPRRHDGASGDVLDNIGAYGINPSESKNISEESRKILLDLQFDINHKSEDEKKKVKKILTAKRKAPRKSESEKMESCPKHRSNSEQIKKYIAKQKAERQRQQREEKRAVQLASQKRKQQLDELRKRSSTVLHRQVPKKVPKHKLMTDESNKKSTTHDIKEDHALAMMNYKYSKIGDESLTHMDVDDESSTLTGDTEDDLTPVATPRDDHWKTEKVQTKNEPLVPASLDFKKVTAPVKKLDIDVDGVLSTFSKYKQSLTGTASILPDHAASLPTRVFGPVDLKTIYEASTSLRSRLQSEPAVQNHVAPTGGQHYDRITGKPAGLTDFGGSLPGNRTTDWQSHYVGKEQTKTQNSMAAGIRTAFHECTGFNLPSRPATGELEETEESSLSETSTFDDITITEASESDSDNSRPAKISKQHKDWKPTTNSKRNQPACAATYKPTPIPACDKPTADPYSVLNIFNRKMKQLGKQNIRVPSVMFAEPERRSILSSPGLSQAKESVPLSTSNFVFNSGDPAALHSAKGSTFVQPASMPYRAGIHSTQSADTFQSNLVTSVKPALHISKHEAKFLKPDIQQLAEDLLRSGEAKVPDVSQSETFPPRHIRKENEDDLYRPTFESTTDESGAPSIDSEEEKTPQSSRQPMSLRNGLSMEYDSSVASEDEHVKHHSWHERVPPVGESLAQGDQPRFSPFGLEQKMMAELNKLESMEESLRQLTGIDRTHALSLAQQETVSLAQILKSRQQAHEISMQQLKKNVEKENAEAEKDHMRTMRTTYSVSQVSSSSSQIQLMKKRAIRETARAWKLDMHHGADSIDGAKTKVRERQSAEDVSSSVSTKLKKKSASFHGTGGKISENSRSSVMSSVKTAEDSMNDTDTESSIRTISDAEVIDDSKAESISEDIHGEDYTQSFNEESLTEDESFWQVLPSESHRKDVKKRKPDQHVSRDDLTQSVGDISSLFVGEDSFKKFTADMVRQFMHDDLLRTEHQAAILRLREKALKEKTKAELAWINQQKQNMRKKGHDDAYPRILKQEKMIKKRQKEQEAEIRRLQEANMLANKERQLMLKEHERLTKELNSTQAVKPRVPAGRLSRPQEVHTEDEVSAFEDEDPSHVKECKSDSEVYGDKTSGHKAKGDKQKIAKQQKIRLDQKYLTAREHVLFDRRKNAEDLLAWKMRLDEEERDVIALEREAKEWKTKTGYGHAKSPERLPSRRGRQSREDKKVAKDEISEHIVESLSQLGSKALQSSEIKTTALSTKTDSKKLDSTSPSNSVSDGSIPEEISVKSNESEVSITMSPEKRMTSPLEVTSVAVSVDGYDNDTFEGETSTIASHKSPVRRKLMPAGSSPLPSPFLHKAGSESESEDSVSHTETLSDASDYEVRIRQLGDELTRRKKEVDILRRERKKKQRDKMKAHEEALKKQIEAYDKYIGQLKSEHADLENDAIKSVVKPQIKQPKILVKTNRVPPDVSPTKSLHELDNGNSSGLDETHDGTDSNQTSPTLSDNLDLKLSPTVIEDSTPKKLPSYLDRISEGSESDKSHKSAKNVIMKENMSENKTENSVTEIIEEVSQLDSIVSEHNRSENNLSENNLSRSIQINLQQHDAEITTALTDHSSINEKVPHDDNTELSIAEAKSLLVDTEVSEAVRETVSKSMESSAYAPFFDLGNKPGEKTEGEKLSVQGIVESDSENESQEKDNLSQPSSERSLVSNNYSETFEDDMLSLESEQGPVGTSLPKLSQADLPTNEDISEHVSTSFPTLSEKRSPVHKQDMLDKDLDELLGGLDDDVTPTPSLHEEATIVDQEENSALLLTDPLADFSVEDRVLVWGRKSGRLLFKGKVEFAPGVWAGVELDDPEGDMDGFTCGVEYFSCKPQHGVLVAGSDIAHLVHEKDLKDINDDSLIKSPNDSITDVSATTDSELERAIEGAAQNVELFDLQQTKDDEVDKKETKDKTWRDVDHLADDITNHLTESLLTECFEAFGKINDKVSPVKKVPPPTLPKPKVPKPEISNVQTVQSKEERADSMANNVVDNLMDDAIVHMMQIRNNRRSHRGVVNKADLSLLLDTATTEEPELKGLHEDEESRRLSPVRAGEAAEEEPILRPGSPAPGTSPLFHQMDQLQLGKDLDNLLGIADGEFFDDDLGFDHKPPPPYPGSSEQSGDIEGDVNHVQKVPEEIFYAIPHEKAEVDEIVASAVDIYWNCRRCGEPMDEVEPSDSYFCAEDRGDTLESNSRHVYKQLLFNLTGEIIQEIYKDENEVDPPAWQKPKRKQQKYYKGMCPPTTKDVLQPVVQNAVNEILGTHKRDKTLNKWNIRKKKDHVDNILVQELREEEANWVNYDEDEVAVKLQLTDNIFESLLSDTVHAVNGIFHKRLYSQLET